ncbi:MAG: hypothetical protein ACP5HS_10550 [Anaerolineae bacterium]
MNRTAKLFEAEIASGLLRWGIGVAIALGVLALAWVGLRKLTEHWERRARRLAAELGKTLASLKTVLSGSQAEAELYPSDIGEPYGAPASHLGTLLDQISKGLAEAEAQLAAPTWQDPPTALWARIKSRLWSEPRSRYRRLTQLKALAGQLATRQEELDRAELLLRDLRSKPWETAQKARALWATLDFATGLVAALRAAGVRGKSLTEIANTLSEQSAEIKSLPAYLLASSESRVARYAQPSTIVDAWHMLTRLEPIVYANADTLEHWNQTYAQYGRDLEEMAQAVANATTHLGKVHPDIDISELVVDWQAMESLAQELTALYETPSPEDLDRVGEIGDVTQEATRLVARLASLEALRTSLEDKLRQNADRLDETERQLRQLAAASRFPLDRVPFQAKLDQLRRELAGVRDVAKPRSPKRLEADLASVQVLDRQVVAVMEQVSEAREERRRLIRLLDDKGPQPASTPQLDWLTWAHDLHKRACIYSPESWTAGEELRVQEILADAQALEERRQRWVPQQLDELLSPGTLAQRVREVEQLSAEIDAFEVRLDRITRQLQEVQSAEERARTKLEAVYGALDRLDIIAASILPADLSTQDNHWSAIRESLDMGYTLELSLENQAVGSVWQKVDHINAWVASCETTLSDWHRTLSQEAKTAIEALHNDLDDLAGIAPLTAEATVRRARDMLESVENPDKTARSLATRTGQTADIGARVTQLADAIARRLRSLADLDQTASALHTAVLTTLAGPVARWQKAEQEADAAFGRLQVLETKSARQWPPIACGTRPIKAQFEMATEAQAHLLQDGTTVRRALEIISDLIRFYTDITSEAEARYQAYETLRPQLDTLLDRLDQWTAHLATYGKRHDDDPDVVAAVRVRLDEIEAAQTQLQVQYDHTPDLVPGEEALRSLKHLWQQAYRDLPIGAGRDVIPAGQIWSVD